MNKKQRFKGYWWIPEQSENKVGGIATFSPGSGIQLSLFSALNQDPEYLESGSHLEYDELFGLTTDGEKITLRECMRSSYSISSSGTDPSEYVAISALVGGHYRDEELNLQKASIAYPLLNQWAGITGVDYSGFGDEAVEISYDPQQSPTVDIGDYEIGLQTKADFNIQRVGGATINEETYFEITPSDGYLSYDQLLNLARIFQDFVTLGTGKEVRPKELKGTVDSTDIEFLSTSIGPSELPDKLHPLKANFTYSDISGKFESILSNWFQKSSELEPVYNLYFSVQYNEDMYVQNQFLSLTRALEIYHRRYFEGEYISDEEWRKIHSVLQDQLPTDLNEEFKDHLMENVMLGANEYSLDKRISEIIEMYEDVLSELPWNQETKTHQVVDSYRYFTQYDESLEGKVSSSDLADIIYWLQSTIETALLSEIGIPQDQIKERLKQRYSELA